MKITTPPCDELFIMCVVGILFLRAGIKGGFASIPFLPSSVSSGNATEKSTFRFLSAETLLHPSIPRAKIRNIFTMDL